LPSGVSPDANPPPAVEYKSLRLSQRLAKKENLELSVRFAGISLASRFYAGQNFEPPKMFSLVSCVIRGARPIAIPRSGF
jgi:hypothetical protein